MASCGAELEANRLLPILTEDATFPIPVVDLTGAEFQFPAGVLSEKLKSLKITDITDGLIDGAGAFDALMKGFKAHLQKEWDDGRITGDDYTKAYIALTESAMSSSIAFILGKDQAFWQAQLIQVQAFSERVNLETTKVLLAAQQFNAAQARAAYAKTKMETATEEITYCTAKANLEQLIPLQVNKLSLENSGQTTANSIAGYNLSTTLPKQSLLLDGQLAYTKEQTESQRAQTIDSRTDGSPVTGVLGKQKDLYSQQITSYQRDAELKAARVWSDAWITQKTIDEGLTAPPQFTNANVDSVLSSIRQKNGL